MFLYVVNESIWCNLIIIKLKVYLISMVHECIFIVFLGHESLAAIMTSRLRNLSVVARHWGDGDIKVSKTSLNQQRNNVK